MPSKTINAGETKRVSIFQVWNREHSAWAAFPYQVDRVEHLDLPYRGAAWIRQVTVVIADGESTQSWREAQTAIKTTGKTQASVTFKPAEAGETEGWMSSYAGC